MHEKFEDVLNSRKQIKESQDPSSNINQGTSLPLASTSPYSLQDSVTYVCGMFFGDAVSQNECGMATPGRIVAGHVVGVKKGSLQSTTANTNINTTKQPLRIMVTGDVMVSKTGQPIELSDELKESISQTDVIVINLESPISFATKDIPRSGLDFIMSKTYLEQLVKQLKEKNAKLTIVYDIANNHTLDGGGFRGDNLEKEQAIEALDKENFPILRTVAAIRGIDENAVIIGAHLAEDRYQTETINCQANPIAIIQKNGMRCGFIGFTDVMNHNTRSWDKRVVRMDDIIPQDLEQIKRENNLDQLFLIGHGNIEQSIYPRQIWRDKTLQFLKGGADAVFGHGPHVPLTNEVLTIDGKNKYIAHSVGNFYGPMNLNNTGLNCIANYRVQPDMHIEFEMQAIEAVHDKLGKPVVGIVGSAPVYPHLMHRYKALFPHDKMPESIPKVIVFTDFDGTATQRKGESTVFSPFFKSLLQNTSSPSQNYKTAPMKSSGEIQAAFKTKFGEYKASFDYTQKDSDLLMSRGAVTFFHELLNNPDVKITFVTKNRREYIQELFKYQGFSADQICRLTILDEKDKNTHVAESLKKPEYSGATDIYILDDSKNDYQAMVNAAQSFAGTHHEYNNSAGKFDWDTYLQEIRLLAPLPTEQLVVPTLTESSSGQGLVKIDSALAAYKSKIEKCDFKNFPEAQIVAHRLYAYLNNARNTYKDKLIQGQEAHAESEFIETCQTAIENAKPILERDLSWGDYLKNLLKKLANAVIRHFHPNSMFAYARSPSLQAVQEAEQVFTQPSK